MVAVEIVFLNNLLEAAKDLRDDEILFCPLGPWSESYRKQFGGVIEDDDELKQLTDSDFDLFIDDFRIFGYNDSYYEIDIFFFYVFKSGLVSGSWEEIFGGIRRNSRYLKKEILMDVEHIGALENYDLFVFKGNEKHPKERAFIKTMVNGEVKDKLVDKEKEKREFYLKAIRRTILSLSQQEAQEARLELPIPLGVREKGVEGLMDYIREGKEYAEYIVGGRKVLTIFSTKTTKIGKIEAKIETRLKVDYNKDKVFIALGKVYNDRTKKTYLLGVPLFKGKVSESSSVLRSFILSPDLKYKTVEINKREEPKSTKGKVFAELRVETFVVNALYAKQPKVIEEKGRRRTIEIYDNHAKVLEVNASKREENGKTMYDRYKICDIEVEEDGSFLVKTDYENVIQVLIKPITEDGRGAPKKPIKEYKGEVRELFEELMEKRNIIVSGRIINEISFSGEGKRQLVLEEGKNLEEVDRYLSSSLYRFTGEIAKGKAEGGFPINLSKESEEDKGLIEIIQSGFIKDKISRTLESFNKIVDLCFEHEGRKYLVKTHDIENPEKAACEAAFAGARIEREGLRGEEKSLVEVLKLVSYSYPLMDRYNIERVFEVLKNSVFAAFSEERVPLDDIRVLIYRVNPEFLRLPDLYIGEVPSSSVLFLAEGDKVKVYTKGYVDNKPSYVNVRRVSIGLGDIEIVVKSY